mgnify:CR=1 FL=1
MKVINVMTVTALLIAFTGCDKIEHVAKNNAVTKAATDAYHDINRLPFDAARSKCSGNDFPEKLGCMGNVGWKVVGWSSSTDSSGYRTDNETVSFNIFLFSESKSVTYYWAEN